MGVLLLVSFLGFTVLGIPIVFSMALSALLVLIIEGIPLLIIIQRLFNGTNNFIFTAIPFFVLAGDLMSYGGITLRLIQFAQSLVGHLRGGLGFVTIVASMIFGGVSGSATADTAAIGSIVIPAMKEEGYDRDFSAAVVAAAGTLGIIIPPSIPMIIYGVVANESIGRLFLGGFIPGMLVGLGMMVPTYFIAKRKGYPKKQRASLREIIGTFKGSFFALVMPVIIIGSIIKGVVTPTEAGVLACLYALMVGVFIYRELRIRDLPKIFAHTVVVSASIMIIMSVADIFGWLIANLEVAQAVTSSFTTISQNKYVILLLVNIFLLITGCLVDLGPALIILTPILLPLVRTVGVDPIHFGLIMTLNLGIGLFTPPVGTNLYVACGTARIGLTEISIAIWPYVVWASLVLMCVTYIPQSVLFIPNLFMK